MLKRILMEHEDGSNKREYKIRKEKNRSQFLDLPLNTDVKARGEVQGQKLAFSYFFTVKSSTLEGIITFYRMKISYRTL